VSLQEQLALIEDYAARSPIADWIGFSATHADNSVLFHLTFGERHIGNALIRAIHGGGIAAFLEFSAESALHAHLNGTHSLGCINADIDYLTSARAMDMTARVNLLRVGRRIAFVEAVGWQSDEGSPMATGRFRFRLTNKK